MNDDSPFNIVMPKIWQPWRCDDLIRLGKDNDGGYLVSRSDVMATKKLVSFGIGCDWIFEQQFLEIAGCTLDAFDEKIPPQCRTELGEFFQGSKRFRETKIGHSRDESVVSVHQCCDDKDIFLKCDIEGGEYQILDDILGLGDIWTGMIFEIHHIDQWNKYNAITGFIAKLPLKLLHIHVNNWGYSKTAEGNVPWVMELTFGRGSGTRWDPDYSLPHALDQTNNPKDGEFFISF